MSQVNASFRAEWQAKGLQRAERADDLTIARRLSLALTGSVAVARRNSPVGLQRPKRGSTAGRIICSTTRASRITSPNGSPASYVGTEDGPLIAYRKRRYLAWLSDELLKNTSYAEIMRQMIASQG